MRKVKSRSQCFTNSILKAIIESMPESEVRSQWLSAFAGDHSNLPTDIDANRYQCWKTFMSDYLVVELASKFDGLNLAVDRKAAAIEKFRVSEQMCLMTNRRFAKLDGSVFNFADPRLSILHGARRKIERLLSSFCWDEAFTFMGFGPGANVKVPRRKSHSLYKFGFRNPTSTGECAALGPALFRALPQWLKAIAPSGIHELGLDIVPGNRVTTVPKSSKIDRVIAIEPMLNMFVQKGIGGVLRRRLKRVGIDLDSQLRNQELARYGSLTGNLATIDLSMASDTISLGLVEWLLPPDWVMAMKICRSQVGTLPSGEVVRYQKVSSMGNGFTFELESLIFWALCSEAILHQGERLCDLTVYGDDIVVPISCVDLVFSVLEFCGFKPNSKKTHFTGPFRESCGKHYFQGREVTPFYIKVPVETVQRKLWLANSLRRWSARFSGLTYGCSSVLRDVYLNTLRGIPSRFRRLSIPEGYGDGGVVRDFDEARPRRHRHFCAYITNHLVRSFTGPAPSGQAALHYSLLKIERAPDSLVWSTDPRVSGLLSGLEHYPGLRPEGVDTALIPTRYRDEIVTLVAPQWEGLGPWVEGV